MPPVFHPRSDLFGDQVPKNSNGTVRPLLEKNRPFLTIHYTGVNVNYGDFDDSPLEIQRIQAWAASVKKPWEYNYVIDTQGHIWEYAGTYRAAHSAGENDLAYGVLFLNGTNDAPTQAQIDALRYLRHLLVKFRDLAPDHEVRPHRDMPGAETSCPGGLILAVWKDLLFPWAEPAPAGYKWVEPHPKFRLQAGDGPWGVARIAYGDGRLSSVLVSRNPDLWYVGRDVTVPDCPSVGFKVRPGDGPYSILRDIWPDENPNLRLATFYRWNGGSSRVLRPGDVVYCPVTPMKA